MMLCKKYVEDVRQNCLECGKDCSNRRSLGNHVARSHKDLGSLEFYVLKHHLKNNFPLCECGCGSPVAWHKTQYKYNSYITGHNNSGFRVKQPKFTKEQVEKRNEAIRKTYALRGDDIKKQISNSVSESIKSSNVNYSEYFRIKWQDNTFKLSQRNARIKSWEGRAGLERREKVFTQSFRRKISLANMTRNAKKTSESETQFVHHLRSIGIEVCTSKWFNFTEKTWCADVWIPHTKTIIEFDGVYWHGLDRDEDYTLSQISNITNDLKKNLIARKKNLNLIRFADGIDVSMIKSYDDLQASAYHVVKDGFVVKEGTFRLGDSTPLITRDSLINIALTLDDASIRSKYLPVVNEFLRSYVNYWGWFYPTDNSPITDVLQLVNESSKKLNSSPAGSNWLKSHIKSFWDVDEGPAKKFNCDRTLESVIAYRLGLNSSKPYTYKMKDGSSVTCRETFNITFRDIRTGFLVQRNKVSWFKPSWAAFFYRKYCNGIQKPVVWDPSIGFSARLLGFSSVFDEGEYIGTDPCHYMCCDAKNIADQITGVKPNVKAKILESGSESWTPQPSSLDLVFTSPPYFNTEKYFDEPGQCWRDYPDLDLWTRRYLEPTLRNARIGLRLGRKLIINISQSYKDLIISTAQHCGFELVDEVIIGLTKDHFQRANAKQKDQKNELFLIFE